jgi:hypothetical protein
VRHVFSSELSMYSIFLPGFLYVSYAIFKSVEINFCDSVFIHKI